MSESEPAATPTRLMRVTATQAAGTVAEVFIFGIIGLSFAAAGFGIALGVGIPGAAAIEEYLMAASTLPAYLIAAGVLYSSNLIAIRTRTEAGLETLTVRQPQADTRIEQAIDEIYQATSVASYTASILLLTAIFVHQAAAISPVVAMGVLAGYPYLEYRALVATARTAETPAEATSPITPGVTVAGLIAMVMVLASSPILLFLRMLGYIASVQAYVPSFDRLISNIRDSHGQVLFYELANVLPTRQRSS